MNRRTTLFTAVTAVILLTAAAALADIVFPKPEIKLVPKPTVVANPPSATPSAAPSATPTAAPAVPGEVKPFAADPPSADKTPVPTAEEWKNAPRVSLAHDLDVCKTYRVREWLKIHCTGLPAAGVSLLAGSREGVEVYVDPRKEADATETRKALRNAQVIFPVRRGDGRVFQIGQFGEGWDGPLGWNVAVTVSEQWVEGEAAPIVTLR